MKMDVDDDVESFEMQKVTLSEYKENKGNTKQNYSNASKCDNPHSTFTS